MADIQGQTLRDQIQQALTAAMKNKDERRVSTLRLLWATIRNEEIKQRPAGESAIADVAIQAIVARLVKQYQDAIADFTRGGRTDLIAQTEAEIAILQQFLPAALSDEALRAVVREAVNTSGAKTQADLGRLMGVVMKAVAGQADGNRVREMVQKELSIAP